MSVVTVRPDTDVAAGDSTIHGGSPTRHAALSDNSDSTYVEITGINEMDVRFPTASLPSGAVMIGLVLRARIAKALAAAIGQIFVVIEDDDGNVAAATTNVSWVAPTTISLGVGIFTANPTTPLARIDIVQTGSAPVDLYEIYCDVEYVAKPVVSVTSPVDSSTVTDTNVPLIEWTDTLDAIGGPQVAYEVKLFSSTEYSAGGFSADTSTPYATSGITDGDNTNWGAEPRLPNDSYRAYVRVAQSVGGSLLWSAWQHVTFTIDVPIPADPSIELNAESGAGRIRIDITDGAGGETTTDYFEIARSDDGGESWSDIRTVDPGGGLEVMSDGGARAFDFEATNDATPSYRVRAVHDFGGGLYSVSAWVSADAGWSSSRWWLKHPTDSTLSVSLERSFVDSEPGYSKAVRQGVMQPLGASLPIVVSGTRGAKTGTLRVLLESGEDQEALVELLDSVSPVLVQAPDGDNWPDRWVSFGDQSHERAEDKLAIEDAFEELPWTEVARPDGDMLAWPAGVPPTGGPGDDVILI
jgi:hypothetical protein